VRNNGLAASNSTTDDNGQEKETQFKTTTSTISDGEDDDENARDREEDLESNQFKALEAAANGDKAPDSTKPASGAGMTHLAKITPVAHAPALMQLQVGVPPGHGPGDLLLVNAPGGQRFQVTIPKGAAAGQNFLMSVPALPVGMLQSGPSWGKNPKRKRNRSPATKTVPGPVSKFKGVYASGRKWMAQICYGGKSHYLGSYDTEELAAAAYNTAASLHGSEGVKKAKTTADGENDPKFQAHRQKGRSGFIGVKARKSNRGTQHNKWQASICYTGKQHSLGVYRTREEAAAVYDEAARVHHGTKAKCNFASALVAVPLVQESLKKWEERQATPEREESSGYYGVCASGRHGTGTKWTASMVYNGETHSLGTFYTKEEAAACYDTAARRYHGEKANTNFASPEEADPVVAKAKMDWEAQQAEVKKGESGYYGVSAKRHYGAIRWHAKICYGGKTHDLGSFCTKEQAALAYDKEAREHTDYDKSQDREFDQEAGKEVETEDSLEETSATAQSNQKVKVNFSSIEKGQTLVEAAVVEWECQQASYEKRSSGFYGVVAVGSRWAAQIRYAGRKYPIGSFKSKAEAALAYDEAARAQFGNQALCNFEVDAEQTKDYEKSKKTYLGVTFKTRPKPTYKDIPDNADSDNDEDGAGSENQGSVAQRLAVWEASFSYTDKKKKVHTRSLGSYRTNVEAAAAHDQATENHFGGVDKVDASKLNFKTAKERELALMDSLRDWDKVRRQRDKGDASAEQVGDAGNVLDLRNLTTAAISEGQAEQLKTAGLWKENLPRKRKRKQQTMNMVPAGLQLGLGAAAGTTGVVPPLEERLCAFYQVHNPSKLLDTVSRVTFCWNMYTFHY
jgi:hypothetical protein